MSDLISREAAINTVYSMLRKWDTEDPEDLKNMLLLAFQELPSAQPERKAGRWKYETMKHIITGETRIVRICSECDGGWFRYDMSDGVEDAEPNYCPNCGARMRGEEDE